ncbi:MAG: polymerase sigma factor, sigma-70 family [Acidobacteria bacterium]|jgi:RNA polymerase sigma-70 factor (ECF subfamily)|nr:polymerase sigma factor, sigma-70 family [Acidobacteriota bacterium]
MAEVQGGVLPLQELEIGLPQSVPGTDNQLVRDFISGNDAAFTLLVTKYKDSLTNYLNVMIGNYDIAADLAQETFLRVYKNIGRYSNMYQFSTWLYRIATNLAIDEMRYRKRRGQVFYNNVWDSSRAADSDRPEMQISDVRRGPRDEFLCKERGQVIGDAIRSLPEKYRTAFVMKEVQELSYETIAQVLKCSVGTVKSRLHRSRELLQRKLEHYV